MACGCKKKKKKSQIQQNVDYSTNGNGTVRLGLKPQIRLPVRLPGALNGQDVVVIANKLHPAPLLQTQNGKPALVITGRNAFVDTAHKEMLLERWPSAFNV